MVILTSNKLSQRQINKARRYIEFLQKLTLVATRKEASRGGNKWFCDPAKFLSEVEGKMWVWDAWEQTGWGAYYEEYRSYVPAQRSPESVLEARRVAIAYLQRLIDVSTGVADVNGNENRA